MNNYEKRTKVTKCRNTAIELVVSECLLTFNEWYDLNEELINIELAENGADREMDFNCEDEFEKRYEIYLNNTHKCFVDCSNFNAKSN
jgi:hypothetical protein